MEDCHNPHQIAPYILAYPHARGGDGRGVWLGAAHTGRRQLAWDSWLLCLGTKSPVPCGGRRMWHMWRLLQVSQARNAKHSGNNNWHPYHHVRHMVTYDRLHWGMGPSTKTWTYKVEDAHVSRRMRTTEIALYCSRKSSSSISTSTSLVCSYPQRSHLSSNSPGCPRSPPTPLPSNDPCDADSVPLDSVLSFLESPHHLATIASETPPSNSVNPILPPNLFELRRRRGALSACRVRRRCRGVRVISFGVHRLGNTYTRKKKIVHVDMLTPSLFTRRDYSTTTSSPGRDLQRATNDICIVPRLA